MKDGTREEYEFLRTQEHEFNTMTADRILRELASQSEDTIGAVSYTHLTLPTILLV